MFAGGDTPTVDMAGGAGGASGPGRGIANSLIPSSQGHVCGCGLLLVSTAFSN